MNVCKFYPRFSLYRAHFLIKVTKRNRKISFAYKSCSRIKSCASRTKINNQKYFEEMIRIWHFAYYNILQILQTTNSKNMNKSDKTVSHVGTAQWKKCHCIDFFFRSLPHFYLIKIGILIIIFWAFDKLDFYKFGLKMLLKIRRKKLGIEKSKELVFTEIVNANEFLLRF